MTYGITINMEYRSVITGSWHPVSDSGSKSSIFGNKRLWKWYYLRGRIRRAR